MAKIAKKFATRRPVARKGGKSVGSGKIVAASRDELLKYYGDMLLIRRFEEKAGQMYGMGLIGGFCHLYIGQEAVVVGMQAAINEASTVVTSYRDHGHMLATGMEARGVMAELTGRIGREKNFFGGHGIVAAQVPIGTGLAFAHKYKGENAVCLTYLGDGAANQGQVYESFNMAALWKLPCIYVIENNKYAMGTSVNRGAAGDSLAQRGSAYGIPGIEVDGMDVLAVKTAGEKAVAYASAGKGPIILEMKTYRYRGHSMSDPAKYRTKDEVNRMRQENDPIDNLRVRLAEAGVSDDELKGIDRDIRSVVTEAADFAQSSPEPDPRELYTDILVEA
jgi:pyruvate dehydrogenase E1 component alpha subunit